MVTILISLSNITLGEIIFEDILEEGQTKSYEIEGIAYNLTNTIITDTGTIYTKFVINGIITPRIAENNTYQITEMIKLKIIDILPDEAGDVTSDKVVIMLFKDNCIDNDCDQKSFPNDNNTLFINNPLFLLSPSNISYNQKNIRIEINSSKNYKHIWLTDNLNLPKSLCSNCNFYDKFRQFSEGNHFITIDYEDDKGVHEYQNISFIVDTMKPKIIDTHFDYTTKEFIIIYNEINLQKISFFIDNTSNSNPNLKDYNKEINCSSGLKEKCTFTIDLEDGKYSYWLNITDTAGNTIKSRRLSIEIDNRKPIISIDYLISNKSKDYLILNISVNEKVSLLEYSIDGKNYQHGCTNCKKLTRKFPIQKLNSFFVRVTDLFGNFNEQRIII